MEPTPIYRPYICGMHGIVEADQVVGKRLYGIHESLRRLKADKQKTTTFFTGINNRGKRTGYYIE